MKYLTEFRDGAAARRLADDIARTVTRPWALMEVCGGQTHSIIRNGIDQLLPPQVELIHGPGCPVCVTSLELIDKALAIAAQPGVIFCSFGDMLRVPGSSSDLFRIKSAGGDVRVVYSPLDAVQIARANPQRQVVFFGIGFETTAPANAMAVHVARKEGLTNFSMPCFGAAGARRDHVGAGLSRERISRGRSCLLGDGLLAISADRLTLARSDCHHRIRTTRSARRDSACGASARSGAGHGGKRVRAGGDLRRQSGCAVVAGGGVRNR
jgi:hypothetical protein